MLKRGTLIFLLIAGSHCFLSQRLLDVQPRGTLRGEWFKPVLAEYAMYGWLMACDKVLGDLKRTPLDTGACLALGSSGERDSAGNIYTPGLALALSVSLLANANQAIVDDEWYRSVYVDRCFDRVLLYSFVVTREYLQTVKRIHGIPENAAVLADATFEIRADDLQKSVLLAGRAPEVCELKKSGELIELGSIPQAGSVGL